MQMSRFVLSEIAEEDVDSIHAYIFVENPEAADQVLEAIGESFELLARNPKIAPIRKFPSGTVRFWPVREFPNYLIFYRERSDGTGVEIVRVLHGARDLEKNFRS